MNISLSRTLHLGTLFALSAALGSWVSLGQDAGAQDAVEPAAPEIVRPEPAARTADGLSLVVPEADAAKGAVYRLLPGRRVQVKVASSAPLDPFTAESDGPIGFVVIGRPAIDGRPLYEAESSGAEDGGMPVRGVVLAGQVALDVGALGTGDALRDSHLRGGAWLDAERYPEVRFRVAAFEAPEKKRSDAGLLTYTGTLTGDLTLRGVTRAVRIEKAQLALLPESASSRGFAKGDLLSLKGSFDLALADYGFSNPLLGAKVADVVRVEVSMFFSTVGPRVEAESNEGEAEKGEAVGSPEG